MEITSQPLSAIRFFVDLNGLCEFIDGPIESVLTVTGSPLEAFASTAASYVNWRWGQRGVCILNWLPQILSASRTGTCIC